MEEQKFIDELFKSSKLANSPVGFLPELLKAFFGGEINEATFKKEFLKKTGMAKVCLSLMAKNDIKACKIIFRNEFILADAINFAIVEHEFSGQEFKNNLEEYIKQYNLANKAES